MPAVADRSVSEPDSDGIRVDFNQDPLTSDVHVALFMLERAMVSRGKLLTPLEINKMVYIAHGWILGALGRPLIDNRHGQIQAWPAGPVVVHLHNLLRHFRESPLSLYDLYALLARQPDSSTEGLVPLPGQMRTEGLMELEQRHGDVVQGLKWVYSTYSRYSGGQLVTLTTQDDSPWAEQYRRFGVFNGLRRAYAAGHITNRAIREHYWKRIQK